MFGCLTVLRISTSRRSISGRVTRDFVTVLTAKVADLCGNYTFTVPRSLVVLIRSSTRCPPPSVRATLASSKRPRDGRGGASSVPRAHPRRWLTFPRRRRRVRARRAAAHDAVMSLAEHLLVHDEIVLEARRRGAALVFFSRRVLARLLLFARHARGRRGLGVLLDADASRGRSRLRRAPGGPSVAGRENPGGAFEPLEHHIDDRRSFGPSAGRSASEKLTLSCSHARARRSVDFMSLRKPVFYNYDSA